MTASRVPIASLPNGTILLSGSFLPAAKATAHVYQHVAPPAVPSVLVTVYAAETGGATLAQPLAVDANGQLPGFVLGEQDVDIVATFGGSTATPAIGTAVRGRDLPSLTRNAADDVAAISAGTAGGKLQVLTGSSPSNLQLVGHSYMDKIGVGIANTPASDYASSARIAALFGVTPGQVQNLAVSGAAMRAQIYNGAPRYLSLINPGNATTWPLVSKAGVICSMFGTNDLILGVGSLVQKGLVQGYRSVISRYRAAAVWDYNDPTVVPTGTWTAQLYAAVLPAWGSGAGCLVSSTVGDSITITPPTAITQDGSTVTLTIGFVTAISGGTVTVAVDGTPVGTVDTSGACFASTERGAHCIRIPWTAANTTITLTVATLVSGGPVYFDYWSVEATAPPLFLIGEITVPPNPAPLWAGNTPANVDTANGWLQGLVTEFNDPSVQYVPLDTALGGQTIRANGQGSTASNFTFYERSIAPSFYGLHPNDKGAQIVASQFVQTARNAIIKQGLNPAQIAGYSSAEKPPLTGVQIGPYHGTGQPLQLLDGFDVPDSNVVPPGWTTIMGGWGISGKQLALVHDQFLYPTFTDSFQRANGAVGNGWTTVSGSFAIAGDELECTGHTGGAVPIITSPQQLDVSGNGGVGFTVGTTQEDFFGIVFRYQDASNYWSMYQSVSFGGWGVAKTVAGVSTTVSSTNLWSHSHGDKIHVELNGTSIKVYVNNTLEATFTDSALQTARKTGIRGAAATAALPTCDYFSTRAGAMSTSQDPGFNTIVRDLGSTDGAFQFTVGASAPVDFAGCVFRWQDASNYMTMYESATFGGWGVFSVVAGTPTHVCDCHESNAPGTIVSVAMAGNQFTFSFNGVASAAGTQTVSSPPTGTKAGARLDYQSVVASTIPNAVLDNVMAGGNAFTVVDGGSYHDDISGKTYTNFVAGVATDSYQFSPTDGFDVREINSAGLTSAQIDALLVSPDNSRFVSDPTNHLLLIRQGGKWYKTAALTLIA